jgi:dTDP-4-dehydrorhamnose reductase
MRIVILGAKGMLGGELCRVFSRHEIAPWDFEDLDITNEAEVMEKISVLHPNVIINAAAYNNVDRAEDERDVANLINGRAVGFLAKAAIAAEATLIHFSTDYVFDGKDENGYAEDATPNPISAYGESKFSGEGELQKANKHYLIRLSRLFGKTGAGKKSFVDAMLDLSKIKNEIDVINEELSSPTYAPDLAERTKYILENNLPYGIYHAGNGGACTWYEFAKEIFRLSGENIVVNAVLGEKFPRPAARPKYSVLLNTKLPAMRPWQEALKEYLNF